jgi:hypothetical protein
MAERALWAGPGVRLRDGAVGVVELALRPGGYVRFDDDYVLVAVPRAPRGPLSLLVTGLERAPLRPGDHAEVAGEELRVGSLRIDLTRRASNLKVPGTFRLVAAPEPPPQLRAGIDALAAGDLDVALAALAGRGEGLTPAGDDVLAGYAAARHAAGRPVSLDATRCSPLGRAYLRCAERGELPEDVVGGHPQKWGSTSGFAMLWGMGAAA